MTDTLFEYDHLLMRSEYRTPDIHSHLALHLIVGLGAGLHCTAAEKNFEADAVFIASDVPHTAYSPTGEMLVFLFDPASRYANEIDRMYLNGNRYFCPAAGQAEEIRALWAENRHSLGEADKAILAYLSLSRGREKPMDERVARVLAILRESEEVPEDAVGWLCDRVFLSRSRLSHLFKEDLGISLSRYLAWEKMRKGYILFQKYGNITEAALMAGFDSPSHFAATCRRMFGLSFSDYTKS
ncbi:MAG: helix-turn-helix transcriptional regulator [Oscillospiraceae bacterium]|nr:helix-turn-helix transcriptional regulator [Oscillospiraceae bacterium]